MKNGRQLNADKSDVMLLGTAAKLKSSAPVTSVNIAGSSLTVTPALRLRGVTIDNHLSFESHARADAKTCNYHTRALRHVRNLLSDDTAKTAACSIVASRPDYCNGLLYGASVSTLDIMQRAQNNLVRAVCRRNGRSDAKSLTLMKGLHWLPVRQRIS
jgi:hypothetical protein